LIKLFIKESLNILFWNHA